MKLTQVRTPDGFICAAIVEDGQNRLIPNQTVDSLIEQAEASGKQLAEVADALASDEISASDPIIPLLPSEVWASGCTYAPSAEFRDEETGTQEGMYAYVHNVKNRPEIFFKGTDRICVGPGEAIGIREDSKFTAPEPALCIVINSHGEIQGLTLGNDVSAWDIERENALYLPQSKVFEGCCALGPVIVTPDEFDDPYNLMMTCTITRGDKTTFEGSCSTNKLRRKFEELVEYLLCSNDVPSAAVIMTGTGIIVTEEAKLQPGDVTTIEIPEIGKLSNPAEIV